MKKFALLLTLIILQQTVFGQGNLGIGTSTPNPSAMLDITSPNKGLLVPRVYLKSTIDGITIPLPAHSLLVYNETVPMPAGKGFYYNAGSPAAPSWKPVADIKLPYYRAISDSSAAFNIENYTPYYASSAIRAFSQGGKGIYGVSGTGQGVFATSNSGTGLYGETTSGTGVFATTFGSGYAFQSNGKIKIAGGNTNPGAGKVLTSDASGNATWKSNKVGFRSRAINNSSKNFEDNTFKKVEFAIEEYDFTNSYNQLISGAPNSNTSTFTVPVSGLYNLNTQLSMDFNLLFTIMNIRVKFMLRRNGSTSVLAATTRIVDNTGADDIALVTDMKLLAGDQVWVEFLQSNWSLTSSALTTGGSDNFFSARLIFAD